MDVTSYGGDASGLVWGWRFRPGGQAQEFSSDAAGVLAEVRAAPPDAEGFTWLHFNLTHAGAVRWLERHGGLSDAFHEALRDELRSTRIERDGDALVAVLNDVHYDFSLDATEFATLWVSLDQRLVVTARRAPLRSVDQLRSAIRQGDLPATATELLERLLRAQADVLVDIVRSVTRQVDRTEDELLAGTLDPKRARLGQLRRLLVRLQRLLAPEPASLFRLLQQPPRWMAQTGVQQLSSASEEFSVALRDTAALQERIKLLQEELADMVNERNGRSLFALTVLTVLALPINILAGLFGMNVGGIPLAEHPHGFWILAGLVAVFTGVGGWLAFRRRD